MIPAPNSPSTLPREVQTVLKVLLASLVGSIALKAGASAPPLPVSDGLAWAIVLVPPAIVALWLAVQEVRS